MTVSKVARVLDRSEKTVRRYELLGLLPAIRTTGGIRLFDPAVVAAFKQRQAEQAGG